MFHVKQWSGSTPSPLCCGRRASTRISFRRRASTSSGCAISPIRPSSCAFAPAAGRAGSISAAAPASRAWSSLCSIDGPVTLVEERRLRAEFLAARAETLGVRGGDPRLQGRSESRRVLRRDQRPRLRAARRICSTWAQAFPQQRRSGCFPRAETPQTELEALDRFVAG